MTKLHPTTHRRPCRAARHLVSMTALYQHVDDGGTVQQLPGHAWLGVGVGVGIGLGLGVGKGLGLGLGSGSGL